jgi:predicted nuclease with RNAse H fold
MDSPVWIGADPGGKRNFGLAIVRRRRIETLCVSSAAAAMDEVLKNCDRTPSGVGVDSPLWWSATGSSDRNADKWIRTTYGLKGGHVQAGNSLQGAALIQGIMFVRLMRDAFPEVPVTETHPNALLAALGTSWELFGRRFGISESSGTKHERDAIISAVAAREGFEGRWSKDLATLRDEHERYPAASWIGPVNYWWPDT